MVRNKRRKIRPENHAATGVGYCRVSTVEQQAGGTSIDNQIATIQRYAELKHLTLLDMIVDGGVSGSTPLDERPGGKRLLDLVEQGAVGSIIATKLDRLFRNTGDCLRSVELFEQRGCAVALVDQMIDTSTPMGRFFRTVLAAVAEMERETICDRVRSGLRRKREMNEVWSSVPYGMRRTARPVRYKANPDGSQRPLYGVEPDPREQEVLALMQRGVEQGLSLRKIGASLTAAGYHPRKGKDWQASTIMRVLDALERQQTKVA